MNNWTYKKKNLALAGMFILMLAAAWVLAVSNTVELYSQVKNMEQKAKTATTAPEQILNLKQTKGDLDRIFKKYVADSVNERENIMEIISRYCKNNQLTFKHLKELKNTEENDFNVLTNEMTIEGNFLPLLGLLHFLEIKTSPGRLSCVSFRLEKDNRINKHLLHCHFYIQTLVPSIEVKSNNIR